MKKFQTPLHKFYLLLSTSLFTSSVFASAESENIWLYITLIPVYLVLILQMLIVLLASVMKQFKEKQPVLLSVSIAAISMVIGIVATVYYEPLENVWSLLKYFIPIAAIVIVLPVVQFKQLNKAGNSADET